MRGIGARSACFRRPQLIHHKTRRDIPDSMSISRSSIIVPWHFSQRCIHESPMVLPVRLEESYEATLLCHKGVWPVMVMNEQRKKMGPYN